MSRCIRIYPNKQSSCVYLWCTQKKVEKICDYINNCTGGELKNKINKMIITNLRSTVKSMSDDNLNVIKSCDANIILETDKNGEIKNNEGTILLNFSNDQLFYETLKHHFENNTQIDFDVVCELFNVRKENLKRLLLANFCEKFDYTIETIKVKRNHGASKKEVMLITPKCFIGLCLMSQSEEAIKVKNYFVNYIEKIMCSQKIK